MSKLEVSEEGRPSIDGDSGQSKKCYICSKGFNFRKKHICRFCNNSVCNDHCQKARSKELYEEPQPICDLCNQEEIKNELKAEIQAEIQSLEEELKAAGAMNDRLEREHFEKTAVINKLENDLETINSNHANDLETLHRELAEEELKNKELKENHRMAKETMSKYGEDINESSNKLEKAQEEIENLRKQSEILKETKESLNEQIDRINARLKGSLNLEHVNKLLCPNCSNKLVEANQRRVDAPSILEDPSVVSSVGNERESIMQSVRELKDALAQQNSRPTESAKCLII